MDILTYKCPGCGAALEFGIDSQQWDCKFCGTHYTKEQLDKMAADEEGQAGSPSGGGEKQYSGFSGEASAYECPNCGGHIITDSMTTATFCVYCHNPAIIASRLKNDRKPDFIIPFKKKKDEAVAAAQNLCKMKPLLPKAFRESVQNGEVTGLYVPFWLFSCDMSARLEGRGQHVSTWQDSKYIYTKTDTYSVLREADLSLRHVPADGSSKMDDTLMESLEPYDYKDLQPFSMDYMSGHFADTYDIDSRQSENRVVPRIKNGAAGLMREQVSGYTSFRANTLDVTTRSMEHQYAMLPVWTLIHEFGGKRYYFAMNGQTGKMTGRLPVSWPKFFGILGCVSAVVFGVYMIFSALNL